MDFEDIARRQLQRYRDEASLIVTSRLHVALPCIAMGIPVIFITNNVLDPRFDTLHKIIPIYHTSQTYLINWDTIIPADVTELKEIILANAQDRIIQKPCLSNYKALQTIIAKKYS